MTTELNDLKRLEAKHLVKYDGEDFSYRKKTGLERFTNVDNVTLKRANPKTTLEGFANMLIADHERLEIEWIRANPPVYDRSFIENRNVYSIMSLYSDYKDLIEGGYRTWDDYKTERFKWRRCKHVFCMNVYPIDRDNFRGKRAKRKDSKYCSEACKVNHRDAKRRLEKTGSLLPEWFYLPNMSESVNDRTRRREWASEYDALEREINKPKDGNRRKPKETPKEAC
jgi:hypothetical protein